MVRHLALASALVLALGSSALATGGGSGSSGGSPGGTGATGGASGPGASGPGASGPGASGPGASGPSSGATGSAAGQGEGEGDARSNLHRYYTERDLRRPLPVGTILMHNPKTGEVRRCGPMVWDDYGTGVPIEERYSTPTDERQCMAYYASRGYVRVN